MLPAEKLKAAGMTWENLSEWSPEGMTGRMWDAIIPNMGFTALIRNLRNFDEKGISEQSFEIVIAKLTDSDEVAKSRVFPYQLYQAYRSTDGFRWAIHLETALNHSLGNIPVLDGRTLVLVDRSGSMFWSKVSDRSVITFADVGSLFGAAWKLRNPHNVDLFQFGSDFTELHGRYRDTSGVPFKKYTELGKDWHGVTRRIEMNSGSAILRSMDQFQSMGGTELYKAIEETYVSGKYARVIIITDEQASKISWLSRGGEIPWEKRQTYYDEMPAIDKGSPVYIWNLAGYQAGITKSGRYNRHTFGGLTDGSFKQIPILESGLSTGWPWEKRTDDPYENGSYGKGGLGTHDYFSMRD